MGGKGVHSRLVKLRGGGGLSPGRVESSYWHATVLYWFALQKGTAKARLANGHEASFIGADQAIQWS